MSSVAGFWKSFAFIIRRERITSSTWLIALAIISFGITLAMSTAFSSPQDILMMADMLANPAMQALMGPTYGLDNLNSAIVMSQSMLILMTAIVAVMNIFLVVRHTRNDEELGRLEMLRSLPIGRLTNPASTLFFAVILNILIGIFVCIALLLASGEGMNFAGASIYSASIAIFGVLFATIALFFSQIFSTSRGALTGSFIILGIFFILRAFGDMNDNIMGYISPMGLSLRVFAFYANNWWPILILLIQSIIIGKVTLLLCCRRDLGEGIIAARKGVGRASKILQTRFGFAWRMIRGNFIAWTIIMLIGGATYGAVIGDIGTFVQQNELFQQLLGVDAGDQITEVIALDFTSLILVILSVIATIPVIIIARRIRAEEKRGRLEAILARSVRRQTAFGAYLTFSAIGGIWFVFCAGLGFYGASVATAPNLLNFSDVIGGALAFAPAVWVMLGLTALFVGLLPKLIGLVWMALGASFMVVYLGPILGIPDWASLLTPFGHVPRLVDEFSIAPLIIMTILSAILITTGLIAFRRRDISSN